jgi:hypothetical protein
MTPISLDFSLSANVSNASFILLCSASEQPLPMTYQGPGFVASTYIYLARVALPDAPTFPVFLTYRYIKDGFECFPNEGTIIVTRPPVAPSILVCDDLSAGQYIDRSTFTVTFHLRHSAGRGPIPAIKLSETGEGLPMVLRGPDDWAVTHKFSIFTLQPIFYKYALVSPRTGEHRSTEPSRPHSLFIRTPIGGSTFSVYDTWHSTFPPFAFISRPVDTSTLPRHSTIFSLEVIPPSPVSACYFNRTRVPPSNDTDPLVLEGAWILNQELTRYTTNFTFSLGWGQSRTLSWSPSPFPAFTSSPPQDAIIARQIIGSPLHRGTSIYLPLVSLRSTLSHPVGDFSVIPDLAGWAKSAGIAILHIHIEQLEGNLLDPVHAQIPHGSTDGTLCDVRDAKLASLSSLFAENCQRENLRLFAAQFSQVTEHCRSEFALFVQWVLHCQLVRAYERVAELGVQLMLDVPVFRPHDIARTLVGFSHFAQSLKIVGLEALRIPVQHLVETPIFCPAAISVSEGAAEVISAKQIHFLPSVSKVRKDLGEFQILGPKYLSPEVVSEFEETASMQQMRAIFEKRAVENAIVVELYFGDLISVMGGERVRCLPLQLIKDHCRFLFPFTVQELRDEQQLGERIGQFLDIGKRWAQN